MYGETERNVEDIESEIGTRIDPAAEPDTVDCLAFVADIETEDAEREVATDVFHHKDAKTGRVCQSGVEEISVGATQF